MDQVYARTIYLLDLAGTCEWQFSPPYNPAIASDNADPGGGAAAGGAGGTGVIVYVCCADAQELQDLLWSLKVLDSLICGSCLLSHVTRVNESLICHMRE